MKIDIHTHIDSVDPAKIKIFIQTCEQAETVVCMCSANPRGDHASAGNNETLKLSKAVYDSIMGGTVAEWLGIKSHPHP